MLQLYANDPDNGVNGSVVYSLVQQSSLFQVSRSGLITTASGSSFDRETVDKYYLTVQASDGGNPPQTGTMQCLL